MMKSRAPQPACNLAYYARGYGFTNMLFPECPRVLNKYTKNELRKEMTHIILNGFEQGWKVLM